MRNILQRLWTGIVAAVASASLALVVSILLVKSGKSMDVVMPTVAVMTAAGFILGLVFGGKKPK